MPKIPRPPKWFHLPRQPLVRHLILAIVAGGGFYLLTNDILSTYNTVLVGEIAFYAIALGGLSILTGANGQISFGHGALMAVGAYTAALLMVHTHFNLVLELLIAIGAAAIAGVIVGIPATRLKGPYLAGMTLILAVGLPLLGNQYGSVFGGDQGLVTTPPSPPGSVNPELWLTWIEILGALVIMVLLANLMKSRFGRMFRAVRDDEVAASLAGIHVARTKVIAFAVSAGCAGLAGAFLALSSGVVSSGEFPLSLSIEILAGMVLGGAGTLVGAWWGGIALVFFPQWASSISKAAGLGTGGNAYLGTIIFGAVLVLVMMLAPSGIQGGFRRVVSFADRRLFRPRGGDVTKSLQTGSE